MVKVGVIGAGVNGLGCAIKIKEKYPKFDVSSHYYTIPTIFLSQNSKINNDYHV